MSENPLTPAQIDALLADDASGLAADIEQASMDATVARVRAKLAQLERALATTRRRIEEEKRLARKCLLIAMEARSDCRPELVAAARQREHQHLEAMYRARYTLPRIEAALGRIQRRLRARNPGMS